MQAKHTPRTRARSTILAAAALLALGATGAQAVPFPTAATPAAREVGAATEASITVSVALKNRNPAELKALIDDLHTPGSAQFHKFLTPAQFHARFDPAPDAVAAATAYFRAAGLAVARDGHFLNVTGAPRAIKAAFGVELRQFEVAAQGRSPAYRFHAATGEPVIASDSVAASIEAVLGLDSRPRFAPNLLQAPAALPRATAGARTAASTATLNEPGHWTVNDLAAHYNVTPLYDAGMHGEGRTIGIVTLASFTPSDVFQYWNENGLVTDPDRLRIVDIQGGSGPISDAGGSGETTLDVAQSGGMAPAANIVVYEAPNTTRAFVDAFYRAVDENVADSISVSWGSFEWFDTLNRMHAKKSNLVILKAFNQIFMQAAAQGQSLIAAQGDFGAYEANRGLPVPYFDPVLSVGAPADSPYITSAGGTTLAGTQRYIVDGKPFDLTVASEQAWGWSYMTDLCAAIGFDPLACGIWGSGGGGGVSAYFPLPSYQKKITGMAVTEAGQSLTEVDVDPPIDYVDLPAGFAGRNVPDISLNADPNTGYVLDYTDQNGTYGVSAFYGGTSFVAPQLNGIAALLAQKAGGRVGLLNYPLYGFARKAKAYGQPNSPLVDITAGDNWFYAGAPGYDQASGLGTLNVANFADALLALVPKK